MERFSLKTCGDLVLSLDRPMLHGSETPPCWVGEHGGSSKAGARESDSVFPADVSSLVTVQAYSAKYIPQPKRD